MINRLNQKFDRLRSKGSPALVPFITANYPDAERFQQLAAAVCEAGADVLEIGFPHSDPLADGPIIQRSSHTAIVKGFTIDRGFDEISLIARSHPVPVVIMCYTNMILNYGVTRFIDRCVASGTSGLIVPDMIIEESDCLRQSCVESNIAFINLVAPTSPPARVTAISRLSSGFVYLVSVIGTTGPRSHLDGNLKAVVGTIRKASPLPVCTGFGISSPEMAGAAAEFSDGVVIGSKILEIVESDSAQTGYPAVRKFLSEIKANIGGRL